MKTRICLLLVLLAGICIAGDTPQAITVTIAANASVSSTANLGDCVPAAIITPTTAAGWTAASIAIKASIDASVFNLAYDEFGSLKSLAAAVDRYIILSPSDTYGFRYIQLVSVDGAGTAVNQTAARALTVVCRK